MTALKWQLSNQRNEALTQLAPASYSSNRNSEIQAIFRTKLDSMQTYRDKGESDTTSRSFLIFLHCKAFARRHLHKRAIANPDIHDFAMVLSSFGRGEGGGEGAVSIILRTRGHMFVSQYLYEYVCVQ
jgi:hypothetical protein